MKMTDDGECPVCGKELEKGILFRRPSGIDLGDFRLMWRSDSQETDEPLGSYGMIKGSFVSGVRCKNCRKIFLDY